MISINVPITYLANKVAWCSCVVCSLRIWAKRQFNVTSSANAVVPLHRKIENFKELFFTRFAVLCLHSLHFHPLTLLLSRDFFGEVSFIRLPEKDRTLNSSLDHPNFSVLLETSRTPFAPIAYSHLSRRARRRYTKGRSINGRRNHQSATNRTLAHQGSSQSFSCSLRVCGINRFPFDAFHFTAIFQFPFSIYVTDLDFHSRTFIAAHSAAD